MTQFIKYLFSNISFWLNHVMRGAGPIDYFGVFGLWWLQFWADIYAFFWLILPHLINYEPNMDKLANICIAMFFLTICTSFIYLLYNNRYKNLIENEQINHSVIGSTIISWFTSIIQAAGVIVLISLPE